MKKYLLTMCTIALFAMGFAASEASEKEKEFQGTYILTDEDGVRWTFTFTCGEEGNCEVTAIKPGMSEDDMYYGNWREFDKEIIIVEFDDFHAGSPSLMFPDGTRSYAGDSFYIDDDGWLYDNYTYVTSKNPEKRIRIVKQ